MERIMTTFKISAVALGMASALALTAIPASAGPLMPNQAAVKAAAPDHGTDVQWRRHRGWGPAVGIGAGLAAGALIGSVVASQSYGSGYYYEEPGYGPGYGAPVYAQPYGYAPMYEAPVSAYGYPPPTYSYSPGYSRSGRCTTDEGYGRRSAC
jgi:hypothetical protein